MSSKKVSTVFTSQRESQYNVVWTARSLSLKGPELFRKVMSDSERFKFTTVTSVAAICRNDIIIWSKLIRLEVSPGSLDQQKKKSGLTERFETYDTKFTLFEPL